MKQKIVMSLAVMAAMVMAGCNDSIQQQSGPCHIKGTVPDRFNGQTVFLVPMEGPQSPEYVDTVVVADGHFEFEKDTVILARIMLGFRMQPVVVVTEPGVVEVTIDSISSVKGTPQNDSLQAWKVLTEQLMMTNTIAKQQLLECQQNDSVTAERIRKDAHEKFVDYKNKTRRLAENMKGTVLGEYLGSMYPKTYQRRGADGKLVTYDGDTNEPVKGQN